MKIKTLGSYITRKDRAYIIYKDYDNENPKKYDVRTIKIEKPQRVTLIKKGNGSSRLELEKGKLHYSHYHTDFGSLAIGVFTKSIHENFSECGGTLNVRYSLDINSRVASSNEINVAVEKIQK